VCKYYGVDEETLKGPQRGKGIAEPRQVAMYLVRSMLNFSYPEMSKLFGRDNATIIHSVKKVTAAVTQKSPLAAVVTEIKNNIENTPY